MGNTVEFKLGGTLKFLVTPDARCGAILTITHNGFKFKAWGDSVMAYALASGMKIEVQVAYVDVNGNPAVVDGDVSWNSSNAGIVSVDVDAQDSTHAMVSAIGATGQVQVNATADVDLGAGVKPLITTMDVEVVAGEAVAGVISPVGAASPI